MTIGQVASKAGLRASAIRYYEAEGLLPPASRQGGKRRFDASIFERLALITTAKRAGFELREIRSLLSTGKSPAALWRSLGKTKQAELDREIARLTEMKRLLARLDRCRCATLEDCGRAIVEESHDHRHQHRAP